MNDYFTPRSRYFSPPPRLDSLIVTRLEEPSFRSLISHKNNLKFLLLWRGSRDGFGAMSFHARCDGKHKTITIIKTTTGYVFGGYTKQAWTSSRYGEYRNDPNAFLFTFKNPHNKPLKLKVIDPEYAVYHRHDYGPTFGFWHDLHVADRSNLFKSSYVWSSSYVSPGPDKFWFGAHFFYGDDYFQIAEIELFQIE